jgi:hypothetical protein
VQVTKELADAILKLRPYPSFQLFVEAIHQDGVQAMLDLVNARPEAVGRLQGIAHESLEICNAVEQAGEILAKFEKSNPLGENGENRSTRSSSTGRGAF